MSNEREHLNSRRSFINKSGMTLLGTALLSKGLLSSMPAKASELSEEVEANDIESINEGFDSFRGHVNIVAERGGRKPVYLVKKDVTDVVVHSLAENLFWNDLMLEHTKFIGLLLAGPDLSRARWQAYQYQKQFAAHLALIRRVKWDKENYKKANSATIGLMKPLMNFKSKLFEMQSSGKLKSLGFPSFYEHTLQEAKRFVAKLEQLNQGQVIFERTEVVNFWSDIMEFHSELMAHMLDPKEKELIQKSRQFANQFSQLRSSPSDVSALSTAGEQIIDFKTAAEKGIEAGQIKSIIQPTMADHVRREAVKFVDELKRSTAAST